MRLTRRARRLSCLAARCRRCTRLGTPSPLCRSSQARAWMRSRSCSAIATEQSPGRYTCERSPTRVDERCGDRVWRLSWLERLGRRSTQTGGADHRRPGAGHRQSAEPVDELARSDYLNAVVCRVDREQVKISGDESLGFARLSERDEVIVDRIAAECGVRSLRIDPRSVWPASSATNLNASSADTYRCMRGGTRTIKISWSSRGDVTSSICPSSAASKVSTDGESGERASAADTSTSASATTRIKRRRLARRARRGAPCAPAPSPGPHRGRSSRGSELAANAGHRHGRFESVRGL
jgi:hypothetical protein